MLLNLFCATRLFVVDVLSFPSHSLKSIMVFSSWLLKALGLATAVNSACTTNLLVDNYANYANNLNSLGQWTSGE